MMKMLMILSLGLRDQVNIQSSSFQSDDKFDDDDDNKGNRLQKMTTCQIYDNDAGLSSIWPMLKKVAMLKKKKR